MQLVARWSCRWMLMLSPLLVAGCFSPDAETQKPSRPVLVEHPQSLTGQTGEVFPGTVRAREETDLAFRIAGKILTRRAQAGQQVQAGEVLATLDPQDVSLNLKAAEASVSAALADMNLAEAELKRHKDLLDKGYISKSLYDVRDNTYQLARARYEQAQSSAAVVRNQARYATLTADKPGLITAVSAEAGQVVAAGQPIFRFASGGEREVIIHVPEGRLDALRKAEKLIVTLWAVPGKVYPAKIREVNLQADRNTRTHEMKVTILQADDTVQLGMTASVIAGEAVSEGVFIVPLSALSGAENSKVWVVKDGKTQAVPVKVLRYAETGAIVSGALTPDQWIISAGVQLVSDQEPVQIIERKRTAASGARS